MPVLEFEAPGCIVRFLHVGRAGNLDLADVLIGVAAQERGCEKTLTFDRKASKSGLFDLL